MKQKANTDPGSPRAKIMGCRCSGEQNSDGDFWITHGCSVHDSPRSKHFIPLKFISVPAALKG